MTYQIPCHHFFSHSTISVCVRRPAPLEGRATPVSVCCGSLSIQSKCCFYFLPVTPICQGHAKATPPLTLPPVVSPCNAA